MELKAYTTWKSINHVHIFWCSQFYRIFSSLTLKYTYAETESKNTRKAIIYPYIYIYIYIYIYYYYLQRPSGWRHWFWAAVKRYGMISIAKWYVVLSGKILLARLRFYFFISAYKISHRSKKAKRALKLTANVKKTPNLLNFWYILKTSRGILP